MHGKLGKSDGRLVHRACGFSGWHANRAPTPRQSSETAAGPPPALRRRIPEGEIAVVEALPHGRFDDLVKAVVPALAGEGARPSPAPRHFGGGEDVDARPSR
jgi:hypothetical protein